MESIDSADNLVLSGDWNGNILGWDITQCLDSSSSLSSTSDGPIKKKKKGAAGVAVAPQVTSVTHAFTMRAHAQVVSGLQVVHSMSRLYTCSHDHTVKVWDLDRQDCIR